MLHVVGTLGRNRAGMSQQSDAGAWRYDLLDTLRYDLENATAASFGPDKIVLTGHGSLDRNSLVRRHQPVPVTVSYFLTTIHGHRWLVRSQLRRDSLTAEPRWSELICADVSGFSVKPASSALTGIIGTNKR